MQRGLFLTAAWRDLILLNYPVPDELLVARLPSGVALDRYQGSAYVSLVAFDFLSTRVLGVPWPFHVHFAEINLRFYVRQGDRRGVCFVREIVPQPTTALFARLLYNEPYVAAPIRSTTTHESGVIAKEYRLSWRGRAQTIAVRARDERVRPEAGGLEHFFKEHEWGFGRTRGGTTLVYRVEHPVWDVYPVESQTLAFSFADVYGAEWRVLDGRPPVSTLFAVGSEIRVFRPEPL